MSAVDRPGPPAAGAAVASDETLAALEFHEVLECVATFAVSEAGRDAVRARRPADRPDEISGELDAVDQLAAVLRGDGGFRPPVVPSIAEVLRVLHTVGSVLEPEELERLRQALAGMRTVRDALGRLADQAPLVAARAEEIPPRGLERAIERAVDPDGTVRDGASPGLARARRRVRDTRARLVRRLETVLAALAPDDTRPDGSVTVRNGRYVIPLRRDLRGRMSGIVHGESSSGATIFVEPAEAVETGNELQAAEADEARAVRAVLRALTDDLRSVADAIASGWRMLVRVDDLYARARFAAAVNGERPALGAAPGPLVVVDGRHPLLAVRGAPVVPFSVTLGVGACLVVSGPNAGGKTVLLKAVGLVVALVQSGVLAPVGRGTQLPVFGRIFVDIGDHQSLEASLSTFTAHLEAHRRTLRDADQRALVLLDELGGGTDPLEGSALAGAILLALREAGAATIATTHLTQLKELAAETDGMANGSLAFDPETLEPTYRFVPGKPGRSYGIAIARRVGLPEGVIARAEALTPAAHRAVDAMLAALERREEEVARREAAAGEREERLQREDARLTEDRRAAAALGEQLERRARDLETQGREEARRFLLQARRRVEDALALARAAVTEATAKEARRLVEHGVSAEADALEVLAREAEAKGWRVKGAVAGRKAAPAARPAAAGAAPHAVSDGAVAARPEVDLRGLRVDELDAAVARALDDAVVAGLAHVRLIHGKGTGALRARVRELLRDDPRVGAFDHPPPSSGGSGVTEVELAP